MISAAHVVIYSTNAEADRTFFRDVLHLHSVDAGHGWLIFALPPAEAAFHPAEDGNRHELYLMCTDLAAEIRTLQAQGVQCSNTHEERWGSITRITLPSGGTLALYQPKHPTAIDLPGR
jgi:hypothetical protein